MVRDMNTNGKPNAHPTLREVQVRRVLHGFAMARVAIAASRQDLVADIASTATAFAQTRMGL